jgi:ankyrin repeat protein
MKVLLEQLGDQAADSIHTADANGFTPLMWACYQGHLEAATLLLGFGAVVNQANNLGETALHMAIYNDHTAVALELLKAGAKSSIPNKRDAMIPLHIAAYNGFIKSALALLDDAPEGENDLGTTDKDGFTALHYAVLSGNMEVLTLLLERTSALGENTSAPDAAGMTPLMWAVALDNPYVAKCT